jgi:hypothetical protein
MEMLHVYQCLMFAATYDFFCLVKMSSLLLLKVQQLPIPVCESLVSTHQFTWSLVLTDWLVGWKINFSQGSS